MKLSLGDPVIVISGKDKGKRGTVLRVLRDERKVVVSDANLITKHIKKTPQSAGRIVRYERAMDASKVMILDPKTGKPTRIGYKVDSQTGRKMRIAKRSGAVLDRLKRKPADEAAQLSARMDKQTQALEEKETPSVPTTTMPGKETPPKPETPKNVPFWKRMGFGSAVATDAERAPPPQGGDSGGSSAPGHVRSSSRGS